MAGLGRDASGFGRLACGDALEFVICNLPGMRASFDATDVELFRDSVLIADWLRPGAHRDNRAYNNDRPLTKLAEPRFAARLQVW